jgi:MFS family permease
MPIGMFGLGILLLARDATGSFAEAGRLVGAFSVANALGAVAQGRLMDRLGQTRVLRAAAGGHVPALVIAANARAPTWVLALCALCGGATFPQVPAAIRSLWGALVEEPGQRETAYAMVSIVFEVAVVTAPALVAAIVAVSSPQVAVLVAAALGAGASVAFTTTPGSRRWRGTPHEVGWLGPLGAAGMRTVFGVLVAFGTAVGIVQVAVPAFAAERGSAAARGVLLAALSAGSLMGGLVYGALTLARRRTLVAATAA